MALATLAIAIQAQPMNRTKNQPSRPTVIASHNGIRGVARAFDMITQKHADPLDAVIAGVMIQELDPDDQSVGYGGLPNEQGVVQLDASCMHGPTKRAGAVAALEGIATPSLVAKAVMDYTDHVMLAGADAKRFALAMGFKEQELLTEKSRQDWLRWKSRLNPNDNWLDHDDDVFIQIPTGTINMNAVDANGDLGSVTSTSGLAYKIPGRVGDSPIIGAGQYCDNDVGAAGSTGRGEANIKICGAFLIVELMRSGMAPEAACLHALKRAVAMTETRLLDEHSQPKFNLNYYAVAKDRRYGAATLYQQPDDFAAEFPDRGKFAVADADGARLEPFAFVYDKSQIPTSMREKMTEEVECKRRKN
ncbi:MAG: N(4)-(beta-N-acetylglucosaminyl)-L-asparaginase [Planctomycetaceae bacterium]